MHIFISYSRNNQDIVRALVQDIKDLDHEVWFDQELTGGHIWWEQVLSRIRECDVFIFALAPKALNSYACKLEYQYAFNLHKTILPILVADGVSTNLLPPALSTIQFVDYRRQDKQAAFALVKAIGNLPNSQPLPDPLPKSPEVPISYLGNLKDQIETVAPLSFQEQTALLLKLKERLDEVDEFNDVLNLLRQLRKRDDLFAKVAQEIDALLANTKDDIPDQVYNSSIGAAPHDKKNTTESFSIPHSVPSQTSSNRKLALGLTKESIMYSGHKIEIENNTQGRFFTGAERVFYDGKEVSMKESMLGSKHFFRVIEDGEEVQYEVKLGTSWHGITWWCEIKRNGKIIFTNR
ncbi:MAG TPA: toll/interleukin-1 receptor domain-containing protein [Caldilineaceae bacterium]|nr:toll/interleukin-1 receptor domain-containing protein [Caldilineaceae bacterium]